MFGNAGDVPMSIVLSIGDKAPFGEGDSDRAIVFISLFIAVFNVIFFTIGDRLLRKQIEICRRTDHGIAIPVTVPEWEGEEGRDDQERATETNEPDLIQERDVLEMQEVQTKFESSEVNVMVGHGASGQDGLPEMHEEHKAETDRENDFGLRIRSYLKWGGLALWRTVKPPPTLALLTGLFIAVIPTLQSLFHSLDGSSEAPLGFLVDIIEFAAK